LEELKQILKRNHALFDARFPKQNEERILSSEPANQEPEFPEEELKEAV